MEKVLAVEAGMGRIGRNSLFLHHRLGSRVLLGGLTLNTDLVRLYASGPVGSCGDCRACQRACPTGAISGEGLLDARHCVSYWTVEHGDRGADGLTEVPEHIADELAGQDYVFGCDRCQDVCPDNRDQVTAPGLLGAQLWPEVMPMEELAAMGDQGFSQRFGRMALARGGWKRLMRNVLAVSGRETALLGESAVSALDAAVLTPDGADFAPHKVASSLGASPVDFDAHSESEHAASEHGGGGGGGS